VGARPLCVYEGRRIVGFASTALALTGLEGVGHGLDEHHAAEALALAYSSERTFVEGVRWLPAATALWVDVSGVRRWRWWDPDSNEIVDLGSAAAHERELREAFDLAVQGRGRSAGAVGATLSGGLDSSSAAATAAHLVAPQPFPTYTSAPPPGWQGGTRPGWDPDESALVRALCELHPNMVPSFVHVDHDSDLFDLNQPLWELGAGPVRNPCNLLWIHAIRTRAGEAGVTTLLSGDLGNIFFSSDGPRWLVSHLRAGRIATAVREAAAWKRSARSTWYRTLRNEVVRQLMPVRLLQLVRRLTGRTGPLEEWVMLSSLRPELLSDVDLPGLIPQIDARRVREGRALPLTIPAHYASQADFGSALAVITGVEARDPTSDRRVIEAALRQPEWVRRHGGIPRAVARGAMADRLPAAIVDRTRRGEQLPDWFDVMTANRERLGAELGALEDHPTSRGLIDVPRLRRLMHDWPDRARRVETRVMVDYRVALLRALHLSRYLRWFEEHARSHAVK
jgi:asparagine synthase (glutamine-hydrolysing)